MIENLHDEEQTRLRLNEKLKMLSREHEISDSDWFIDQDPNYTEIEIAPPEYRGEGPIET